MEISSLPDGCSPEQGRETKDFGSGMPQQESDQNSSHKIFVERLEMSVENNEIQDRLRTATREREQEQVACFEGTEGETIFDVRRRCFCESVGRKFCAVCRHKLNKQLSHQIPGIIVDIRTSEGERGLPKDGFLERDIGTLETPLPKQLQQASEAFQITNNATKTLEDFQDLSNIDPDVPHLSKSSSCSSLITPKSPCTPTSSFASPTNDQDEDDLRLSPVVPKLPSVPDFTTMTGCYEYDVTTHGNTSAQSNEDDVPTHATLTNQIPSHLGDVTPPEENRSQRSSTAGQCVPVLPWYSYPVEPVLMELKYINFSIYDREDKAL